MNTALIIIGVLVLLVGLFWAYRQDLIANMSYEEITERLRRTRKTLYEVCQNDDLINSNYANQLRKSIRFLEAKKLKMNA